MKEGEMAGKGKREIGKKGKEWGGREEENNEGDRMGK